MTGSQVWWLGETGWVYNPSQRPGAAPLAGAGGRRRPPTTAVPVYGRAYPEQSAYPGGAIPYQTVTPLQYSIQPGQSYVLADADIETDYYCAKTFS